MADYNQSLIIFHQTNRLPNCPSPCVECLEVETFFRIAGLKYKSVYHANNLEMEEKRCPYVELDGKVISGVNQIVKEICEKFELKIDDDLTAEQRVLTYSIMSMINFRTFEILNYFRFEDPIRGLKLYEDSLLPDFFSFLPGFLSNFLTNQLNMSLSNEVSFSL